MNKFKTSNGAYVSDGSITIEEYIDLIRDGYKVAEIQALRSHEKGTPMYKLLKADRPSIAMHSIYGKGLGGKITRSEDNLIGFTNLMYFDIDDIHYTISKEIYDKAYIIHKSTGGRGWVIVVKVNTINKSTFDSTYEHIGNFELGIPYDRSCNDVSRFLFLSYDPDVYVNPNPVVFEECEAYENTTTYNHNISVATSGDLAGLAFSPLVDSEGAEYYPARQQMAHALVALFGDTVEALNFYKGCLAVGGQNGNKSTHTNDISCWTTACRKNDFNIPSQLNVLNRYCPQLLSVLKIENAPTFTRTINDYVEEDAVFLLDFIRENKRIILDAPPGSGKTSFIKQILPKLYEEAKISVVMPTTMLSEQQEHVWLEGVDLANIEIVTGERGVKNMNIPLLITTYASIKKTIGRKGILCIDEAQHIASDMYRIEDIRNVIAALDEFEYVIFMSGTPINLHLLPGVELIKYNRVVQRTIGMVVGYNEETILTEPDTKKLCFRDNSNKNAIDAAKFGELGFNTISINSETKGEDRIKDMVKNEEMGDLDIIFTTRLMHDGLNIKDGGKKSILVLSRPDHLAYLVQLANRFRDTSNTTLYINLSLRDTNTYLEPDFAKQINYYQKIANNYTEKMKTRIDNVHLIKFETLKDNLPIYYCNETNSYKVCIASLLYRDMLERAKKINEVAYLADYGINIISRGEVVRLKTKSEKIIDNTSLEEALTEILGEGFDWHPELIKDRLKKMETIKWPKCMSRYLSKKELASLYLSVPTDELVSIANIQVDTEYEAAKNFLMYKHYLKNPNNMMPISEDVCKKLTILRNALIPIEDEEHLTTDVYNIVGRIMNERSGYKRKLYLDTLFTKTKINKTSKSPAKMIIVRREI